MSVIEIPLQIPRRLASADPLLLAPVAVLLAFSAVLFTVPIRRLGRTLLA